MLGLIGIILLSMCQGLTEGATWNFIQHHKTRLVKDTLYYHSYRSLELLGLWLIVYASNDCGLLDAISYGLLYMAIYRASFCFERWQSYKDIGRKTPYEIMILGRACYIPYPNWIVIVVFGIISLTYQVNKII